MTEYSSRYVDFPEQERGLVIYLNGQDRFRCGFCVEVPVTVPHHRRTIQATGSGYCVTNPLQFRYRHVEAVQSFNVSRYVGLDEGIAFNLILDPRYISCTDELNDISIRLLCILHTSR